MAITFDPSTKRIILSPKRLEELQKQILIVLADYRGMVNPAMPESKNPLQHEGTRFEIAKRILDNLKCIAKVP